MKKAIVTGGCGFIGSHLVDKLMYKGFEVCVIDNLSRGDLANLDQHSDNPRLSFEQVDIRDMKSLQKVFDSFMPDYVFHLAAIPGVYYSVEQPVETSDVNIMGTVNVLNLAKEHGARFIFSSSSSVYGGSQILPTPEDTPLSPKSPYAMHKKFGEELCELFSKIYKNETVCLRYFNVFGNRQRGDSPYASVISSFLECNKLKIRPIIHGDGEQYRDFTHVDNVVEANYLASTFSMPLKHMVFNVGSGIKVTVNELHEKLGCMEPFYRKERAGDVRCSQADTGWASESFGYHIVKNFDDGLRETAEYYKSGLRGKAAETFMRAKANRFSLSCEDASDDSPKKINISERLDLSQSMSGDAYLKFLESESKKLIKIREKSRDILIKKRLIESQSIDEFALAEDGPRKNKNTITPAKAIKRSIDYSKGRDLVRAFNEKLGSAGGKNVKETSDESRDIEISKLRESLRLILLEVEKMNFLQNSKDEAALENSVTGAEDNTSDQDSDHINKPVATAKESLLLKFLRFLKLI